MTTWSSAENGGGRIAPRAPAEPRPLARGTDGRGGRRLAPLPWACGCSPLRGLRHRATEVERPGSTVGGGGSRLRPVWPRRALMRSGRRWMAAEAAADQGLELVEGGGGVVAQAAFHD